MPKLAIQRFSVWLNKSLLSFAARLSPHIAYTRICCWTRATGVLWLSIDICCRRQRSAANPRAAAVVVDRWDRQIYGHQTDGHQTVTYRPCSAYYAGKINDTTNIIGFRTHDKATWCAAQQRIALLSEEDRATATCLHELTECEVWKYSFWDTRADRRTHYLLEFVQI